MLSLRVVGKGRRLLEDLAKLEDVRLVQVDEYRDLGLYSGTALVQIGGGGEHDRQDTEIASHRRRYSTLR